MSVVCKVADGYKVFVKGSPERISELCLPHTLPHDYDQVLARYTTQGCRVIALAVKGLTQMNFRKVQKLQRAEVEKDLNFLGFLVMENKLKPVSTSVIKKLAECELNTIMATGDNVLTAISVAR